MIFKFFQSWWQSQNYLQSPFIIKIFKSVLFFTILLLIIFIYVYQDAFSPGKIVLFLGENPFLAPTLFILIYAVMVLFFVPTLPMNLLGGLIWGTYLGGLLTVVGASLGSTCAFLMARYFAYDFISRNLDKSFGKWMQINGEINYWRMVAFVRLNPIFPFGPASYFMGITRVPFNQYIIGTILCITPLSIVFAALGASGASIYDGNIALLIENIIIISFGISVLFVLKKIISVVYKKFY